MPTTTPGLVIEDAAERMTPVKWNLVGIPSVRLNANEVTIAKIDADLLAARMDTIAGSVWNVVADRAQQFGRLVMTGDVTLVMQGLKRGMYGTLVVQQDGSGGHALTLPAGSITEGGVTLALTAAANAIDVLRWQYDGTNLYWEVDLNFT